MLLPARRMRVVTALAALVAAIPWSQDSVTAFSLQSQSVRPGVPSSRVIVSKNRNNVLTTLHMSAGPDEIERLRAAAQKAREEAAKMEQALGRETSDTSSSTSPSARAAAARSSPPKTAEELSTILASVDFDSGVASSQVSKLDELVQARDLRKWKSAAVADPGTVSAVSSSAPSLLRPYPVSLGFLESRSGGLLTGQSLGVDAEEVTLENFRDSVIVVVLASTALGLASLALLPQNVGATLCYMFAIIPVLYLGIGSTSPGIIAGALTALQGKGDDAETREKRICSHEAGHFLCGYLCGLPVKNYSVEQGGGPRVEFYPSTEGDVAGMARKFTSDEIATLSVVAMAGSVAEVLSCGEAKGGEADLMELDRVYRQSGEFISAQKQQDLTRWGALTAYNLLQENKESYDALKEAFQQKKSIAECVRLIEQEA